METLRLYGLGVFLAGANGKNMIKYNEISRITSGYNSVKIAFRCKHLEIYSVHKRRRCYGKKVSSG